ncbi:MULTISPECIES: Ig-like domain-containing protein [unclassified Variovorax]|uniref:Ig-like domain-containing protein n=1 Tax=unclassified Variovorax TaxID=663243 RepID=UPI0008D2695A|nr:MULTISPECIES: Ig-like domain-containing protein [unclassified Variovorax]SEK17185.1 Ig-like domain (group 3) [Variovorax sp. OK202]SFE75030.1 Ig-like domain (group 3) [Variovorax sp. OK212]
MNPSISPLRLRAGTIGSRRPLRAASQLLALEQRFMFDGAVADAAHAAQAAHDSAPPPVPPAVEVRAAEPAKDQGKKEVVLVDTSLANYKSLEAGVRDGVGIVEFDGSRDGLAQIAQWAAKQSGLDAMHILSHGSAGTLDLGTTQLTESSLSLAATQAELAGLGRALAADGDLLLYGCDVAAGSGGAKLLDGIAKATGADVAASTDLTGAARLGGNWTLEAHDGIIDARELALTQYDGVLATLGFIYGVDADDLTPSTSIVKPIGSQAITFSSGEIYDYNDGLGIYPLAADHNSVTLTLTVTSGYSFDLNSFMAQGNNNTLSISGTFADGTPFSFGVNGINVNGTLGTVSSFSTPLNDVKSVVITSTDYATFQNFVINDVKALPPVAKVNAAQLSSDSGASGTDFITNTAAQTISGTLSANLGVGEKVQVSYDNGGSWSDATSYLVGTSTWSTNTTLAGSSTFLARVTNVDAASTAYSHTYTLDTTAPTTSFSSIALSADTGASSTDFITKTASQTISATLSGALAGTDVVWGSTDGGSSWTDITSKVSGTTLSWNGTTLGAGSSSIMLKVTDAAGNDSSPGSQIYTLDTTAPTKSGTTVALSNDSGSSSTDFVTNAASQTISGTLSANLASGEIVYVSLDNGSTWTAATAAVGQNTWSLAGQTLTGSSTLRVKVSDTAGNDGAVLLQAYELDTTAPTISYGGLALSADTGSSSTDFITKTAAQTVSATLSSALAASDIVYGSLDNGVSWTDITSKVSGTALSWNGVTLAGSNALQLKVVDAAGNQGSVRSQAYVLDTSAPATPGTPDLASASDTGAFNNDNITTDSTPTLSGTAENGSTVTLYDGVTMLGTVTAGASGWTFTTGALIQGSHTITAVSTDTAGNVSAASVGLTITIDTTAPTVGSVAVPADGTYYSGGALNFTVNFSEAVIVDTFGGTPRIALVVGATTRYADYVSGSGTSALLFRYTVPSGDIDPNGITIGALSANGGSLQDGAGNNAATTLNSVGSTAGVNVDGTNPSITSVSASSADGAYGSGQTITITVDFSTAVNVDTTGGTPTLALGGGGSATYTSGSGTSTLTFTYTVGAGENSADLDYSASSALSLNGATIIDAGGAHQPAAVTLATPGTAGSLGANKDIVIDTAAPTNSVAGAAFSADTGTSGSDFITRTAVQTISGTLASNLAAGEHVYVSLDNGASWALAAVTTGSNTWSLAGQTLTGSGTLKVRVSDDAGNNGTVYSQGYVLDTTAPTISFSGVALSADTGSSSTDFVTSTAAQTITATLSAAPAAGDIVYGSLDNGATWTDITSKVSGTTLSWNGVTLAGSDTLKLRVSDAAGNNGATTAQAYVLDTTAPTTSVASAAFSSDTGASSSDFITRTAAQTVSGTLSANLAAGETVLVSLDNGATWVAASIAVGTDTWALAGQTLTASDTLQVKVVDVAGNDGVVLSQGYVYDTAATVPSVAPLSTMSTSPVLTGSATLAAGETLTITVGGATYDVTPVAGAWSLDLAVAVPVRGTLTLALNQRYEVVASVTDLAGNVAGDTTSGELVLGTVPTTTVTGAVFSADHGASGSDFVTNAAGQTVSGALSAALAASESVEVSLDGGNTWRTAVAGVGATHWSIDVTLAGSGTLAVRVSNALGGGTPYRQAYVLDTTAPAGAVEGVVRPGGGGGDVQGSLSAPLGEGDTLFASRDGGQSWFAVAVAADRTSWSLAGAGDGALQLRVSDLAGNTGALREVPAATLPTPTPMPTPVVVTPAFQTPPPPTPQPWLPTQTADIPPMVVPVFAQDTSAFGGWQSSALQPDAVLRGGLAELLSVMPGPGVAAFLGAVDHAGRDGMPLSAGVAIQDLFVRAGEPISLQLPGDTFAQGEEKTKLELRAFMVDGKILPGWLKFDARTARFEGTPPIAFEGTLTFKVVARDAHGREAVQVFKITVTKDASVKGANAGWQLDLAQTAGRASLSDQLRAARGGAADRLATLSQSAAAARLRA